MEHCIPLRKRAVQFVAIVAMALSMTASWADDAVVLVTHTDSPIEDLSSLDIRKAYLGISVTIGRHTIRPLRLSEDERLNNIFLQTVIAMSQKTYERRLLSMMLKFGTPRPVEVDNRDEQLEQLALNPYAIAYMWRSDAETNSRVKTIKVLWQQR